MNERENERARVREEKRRESLTEKIPSGVDRAFHASFFYRFFRTYDETDGKMRESFFFRLLRPERLAGAVRTFKNGFAAKCEESVLCGAIRRFYERLPLCSLRSVGVLFLYFSLYSLAIAAIRIAVEKNVARYADNLITAAILLLLSFLMMLYKGSAARFVRESRLLSGLFDGLFFSRAGLSKEETYRPQNAGLVLCGTALGALTYLVSVKSILLTLFFFVLILSFFKMPENGMTVPILLCPFCDLYGLGLLVFAAFCGYLFKTLRGKRNFRIESFDAMMLLFALILFTGCFNATDRESVCREGLFKILILSAYFIFRNCLRSEKMLRKCASCLLLSGGIGGVLYLWERLNLAGYIRVLEEKFDLVFGFSPARLFESTVSFGEFLLLCISFGVMCFSVAKNKNEGLFSLICLAACVAPLLLLRSKGVLLALAVGVLIYIVASFHNPVASVATLILVYFAFSVFITQSAFLGNDRFFNVNDYKESILATTADMVLENPLSGIGLGKENFAHVFRVFTHFGDSRISDCYNVYLQMLLQLGIFGALFAAVMAVHLYKMMFSTLSAQRRRSAFLQVAAITCISAVSSLMMRGFTSSVFGDHRVLLLFAAIVGIAAAAYRLSREEDAVTMGGELS